MSDNEIEDVSFLPGESLHRKAVYEPNILQKIRLQAFTKGRAAVLAVIVCLVLLVIALLAALSNRSCDTSIGTFKGQETQNTESPKPTEDYISTNGKPFPYKDIRLPDAVLPIHYKIFMHPNISNSVFTGKVDISCVVNRKTSFIVFHIKDLNITKMTLKDTENGKRQYEIKEFLEYKTNEQVYAELGSSLTSGSKVTLEVSFEGQLISKLAGFYRSVYKTNAGEERYIATTHFEPTDARAAFPCFDEPKLKATFELAMIREKKYLSLFNMPLVESTDYEGGLIQDRFQKSVKMSTYLVAFVVCDYEKKTQQTKRNITVGVYAPKDSIESATFALETAVKIIDNYETFFGVNYPLPKQDLIAIPDFSAGAMENWGLITYRMTAILYEPGVSSAKNQQWVAIVVAHELAHQWFGNLVTMSWWDDLWLNEGFASYVEYIGSSIIEKDWKMQEQFVTATLLNAMYLDSLSTSHPINQAVDNPNQINELFDTITYSKGASIIRMLSNFLGDDVFKTGLTAYLNKYKFDNAATNDLWTSLSGAVSSSHTSLGTDVTSLMRTWTEQMGYPVITLTKAGSKVTVTQSRFLLYAKSNDSGEFTSPFGYKWQVPFSYSTSSDPHKVNKMLLKDTSDSFQLPNGINWVKGNCGMFGYYRVNYDADNWNHLIQQLNLQQDPPVFTAAERAGLIDDAFSLARAGLLKQSVALELSQYLINENDYQPWLSLLDNMKYVESRIENKPVYYNYKMYMMKLLKHQLDQITWSDTGTHLEKYLRASILHQAVFHGHEQSVAKGRELFQNWKQNHKSINVNLKSVIYWTGIAYGTDDDWEYVWNAYLKETIASEKRILLAVLGYSRDTRLLSRLLNYSLNETVVRSQDTATVVGAVSSSPAGQLLSWRFVQQHWKTFHDRYSTMSFVMSSIIKTVASGFDTQFDYDEVFTFFKTRDAGSGNRAVKQVLEKIQMNIDWLSTYEQEVTEWFQNH